MNRWAIDIDRAIIADASLVADPETPLANGEIEVAPALVAVTANNVTYAALGEPMGLLGPDAGYWDFFGPRDAPGRLPVWGFARVTRSAHSDFEEGDEFYGYYALASHTRLLPVRVSDNGFADASPHRAHLPPLYNQYQAVGMLGDYDPADRELWPIYRPLYLTGWLIADQMADENDHGVSSVLVTSASSKTAMSFAHAFRERADRPELVGLTSAGTVGFLQQTGLYDRIVTYDALESLDPAVPTALIDIAGDAGIAASVSSHFCVTLKLNLVVGATHWEQRGGFGGQGRTGFFAPARMAKRSADWGGTALREKVGAAWTRFMADARNLTRLEIRDGPDAALATYRDAVAGTADPRVGVVIALA